VTICVTSGQLLTVFVATKRVIGAMGYQHPLTLFFKNNHLTGEPPNWHGTCFIAGTGGNAVL
jgi:hypothetical protein